MMSDNTTATEQVLYSRDSSETEQTIFSPIPPIATPERSTLSMEPATSSDVHRDTNLAYVKSNTNLENTNNLQFTDTYHIATENGIENNDITNIATIHIAKQSVPTHIFKKAKVMSLSNGKEIYVSYWDLGGDEIYYATHHIHLSPDAVYVCVFDMSEMENEESRYHQLGKLFLIINMDHSRVLVLNTYQHLVF